MNKIDNDILIKAFWRAREELRQAEQNFNYADLEFREAAIVDLLAKRKKLDAILKQIKEVRGNGKEDMSWMWEKIIQCE